MPFVRRVKDGGSLEELQTPPYRAHVDFYMVDVEQIRIPVLEQKSAMGAVQQIVLRLVQSSCRFKRWRVGCNVAHATG